MNLQAIQFLTLDFLYLGIKRSCRAKSVSIIARECSAVMSERLSPMYIEYQKRIEHLERKIRNFEDECERLRKEIDQKDIELRKVDIEYKVETKFLKERITNLENSFESKLDSIQNTITNHISNNSSKSTQNSSNNPNW